MTKKRQAGSSVVSVMEDESLDLQNINEDSVLGSDPVSYTHLRAHET